LLGSHRGGAMVQVLRASSVPWVPVPDPSGPGAGRAVVGAWPWAGWERGGWGALGVPIGPGASPLLTLRGRGSSVPCGRFGGARVRSRVVGVAGPPVAHAGRPRTGAVVRSPSAP